ncbi:MAG: PAS domain S-box protein [Pseudodesulfovibrio sp.]|uniref:PAS domain S-box protein n=1 Tax=Pseudodesulfovibrio sp. TaxID=2035812 RepID=UPI003D1360EB
MTTSGQEQTELEQLRTILQNSQEGIAVIQDGHLRYCNQRIIDVLGYTERELLASGIESFIHPEDRQIVLGYHARRLSGDTGPSRHEFRVMTKSGKPLWVEASGKRIDWEGMPAVLNTFVDISKRKEFESRLHRSDSRYEGLVSSAPIGIFRSTHQGRYKYINERFAAMLGYDKEELLHDSFRIQNLYVDPAAREEVTEILSKKGELNSHPIHLKRKDGSLMWMSIFVKAGFEDQETCYDGFTLDISNEKALGKERDHLKDRLQALWDIAKLRSPTRDTINTLILDEIERSTRSPYSFFGIVDEEGSVIHHSWSQNALAACRIESRPTHAKASEAGVWARPALDRNVLIANDYQSLPASGSYPQGHIPLQRLLSVPILQDGKVIAVAAAANKKSDYTDEDARLIETFVSSALLLLAKNEQEHSLVKSESKYRALFDNAGEGIFLADNESTITDANQTAADMLGYERPEELVGVNARDLIHPDDLRERSTHSNMEMVKAEDVLRIERRYRKKDGSYIPVQVTIKFIGNAGIHHVLFSDWSERKNLEEALQTKIIALTKPSGDLSDITFNVLFDIDELQKIQDEFASATGVASIITTPEGTPITKPSNFTCFCKDIVRSSPKGMENCQCSDAVVGIGDPAGPRVQKCLSGGLWDAGASVIVGGKHLANWLVGQVRDESCSEESILDYAKRIDVDGDELLAAFRQVPVMPKRQFKRVAQALYSFARQLSLLAYQNVQQARLIEDKNRAQENNKLLVDLLNASDSIAIYKDHSLRYLMANSEFLSRVGYCSYLDILGKTDRDLFEGIASAAQIEDITVNDRVALSLPRGQVLTVEERLTGGSEDDSVFLTKKFPIYQEGSAVPSGVATLSTDITEFKRTQESLLRYHAQLKENQETLRLVMNMAAIAPWELDLHDNSFTFNDEFYGLYATSAEREGGYTMSADQYSEAFVHPDEMGMVAAAIADIHMTEEANYSRQIEHRIVRRDGQVRHIVVRFLVIRDPNGAPLKVVGANQDITQQKALLRRLNEREQAYKALVEGIPDVIMRFDGDCRHLYVSRTVERYTPIPPNDFLGKTHAELGFPAAYCDYWEKAIKGVFNNKREFEDEFFFEQNQEFIFNWRLLPEFNDSGQVVSVLSISRDVTFHRRLEQDYRNLFERMLDGFAVHEILCDDDGKPVDYRFLGVNQTFEEMVGLKKDKVVGKTVLELMPGTEPYWIESYGKVALTGEPAHFESYSSELGRHFEVTAYRPAPRQFACIFADVTERKRALDNFERIFDLSLDLICVCDLKTARFLRVNPAFGERLGYSKEKLIGRTIFDFLHPDDAAATDDVVSDKLNKGINLRGFENRLRAKSGEYYWISWYVRPILDEGVLYAVGRDISVKKHYEDSLIKSKEAAEAASKAKSEFLANMSHEIRTPLNGMLGMLQLVEKSGLNPEQSDFINKALFSGERLTRLLTDILDVSAIEAKKLALSTSEVDIASLMESVASLLVVTAQQKRIELRTTISPNTPAKVISDDVRLRQILFNLAGNGLKFTQRGFVSITISCPGAFHSSRKHLLLTIRDTGPGIADDQLDKAFEVFGQIAQGYTKEHQGAGLGLPIVKRIVDLMGGTICVESVVGQGSSFYVSIPIEVHGKHDESGASEPGSIAGPHIRREHGDRMSILLVEDEACNSFAFSRLLSKEGYEVQTAANGKEALDAMRASRYDLVLMDIQMPVMDGIEATQAIRSGAAGDDNRTIPIIAMTAYAMEGDEQRFLNEGMDGYIEKPVRFSRLLELIAEKTKDLS